MRHNQIYRAQKRIEKRIARTGPIPVELLRWKFIADELAGLRTVGLQHNSGLELPANIGELGDSVKKIDLSYHNLRGAVQPGIPRAEAK